MRKILLGMALLATTGIWAAPITAPEAGKAYTIQNATGLYMTTEGSSLKLHELDASNANQRFEFVPVADKDGVYNIKMTNGLYIGTDGEWTVNFKEDPADTKGQYKIVVSATDPECVLLTNESTSKSLGCDASADGSTVYTDKNDSKDSYRWKLALAPEPVSVTEPAADKYYRIRHASGLYLTDARFGSTIAERAEGNTQLVQFVAVDGQPGVYNIRRCSSGMFIGTDKKWSTTAISRNIPQSQFKVTLAEDGHNVLLSNLAHTAATSFLGTDAVEAPSNVYTNKDGKDAAKHLWFIEEAAPYVAPLNAADYADRTNLVVNGDFQAEGYEQEQKDGQLTLSTLPGWVLGQTAWGGAVCIMQDGDNNYVACQGYGDNSWTLDVSVEQEITVKPGNEHALFFDYMLGNGGNCSWGYSVKAGSDVLASYASDKAQAEWTAMSARFTPATDKVTVRFYLTNVKKDWWRDNKTASFDNIRVYDIAPVDFYADQPLASDDPRANAYDGYRLVFAQEFSGEGTPDHEIWNFEEGFCRNREDQYYNGDKNCYIQDGVLVIEGKYVADEKINNPKYDPFDTKSWPSRIGRYLTWTSGSMQSQSTWDGGYSWHYGIYEVRAKVPQHVGSWPAIWSTGKSHEWPYGGEIDIMEYYGNRIHANVCWGNGNRYGATWNSATVHDNELGAGWGDEFHIWRMVWDYDHMELWCDDFLVNNIDLNTTVNKVPTADYDHGNGCNPFRDVRHMLWLNLALGGDNGGSLANTPRPLYYQIDYARVYQKVGTDGQAKYNVDSEISEPSFKLKDGESAGVDDIAADTADTVNGVYNLQGIRVADSVDTIPTHDTPQVYIVAGKERSTKVVL